jgi:hypothetical protein
MKEEFTKLSYMKSVVPSQNVGPVLTLFNAALQ